MKYRVLVPLRIKTRDGVVRVAAGAVAEIPERSVSWLLKAGHIEAVEEEGADA